MAEHTVVDLIGGNERHLEDDVSLWNSDDVKKWLRENGYKEYERCVDNSTRPITGQTLLSFTRDDLQQSPFHMTDLHEVDHFFQSCIEALRKIQITKYMKKIERNGMRNGFHNSSSQHLIKNGRIPNGHAYTETMAENGDAHQYSKVTTPLLSGPIGENYLVCKNMIKLIGHFQPTRLDISNSPLHGYTERDILLADLIRHHQTAVSKVQTRKGFFSLECWQLVLQESKNCLKRLGMRVGNSSHGTEVNLEKQTSLHANNKDGDDHTGNGTSMHASAEQCPSEKLKTFIALMYMMLGFVVSVLMLQLVHERVPAMTVDPPLPDIFFDIIPYRIEGAFDICETAGMVLVAFTFFLAVFHRHRFIIARRIFFIMGTLYLYRSCTMYVTTLPVPGLHFKCAPKSGGKISIMLRRAFGLLYGGGLSVTGSHHLCGDYLFSGHTIVLVMCYLIMQEYTPKRWWWFHWFCWILSATGIVCILLAHDHYTVDVVVAYLFTTRLFWSYHTMCNTPALKDATNSNLLSRNWWFPIFRYFEGNVRVNGRLPRQYEWPLPWPRTLRSGTGRRSPIKGV